jgi:hypothetical protein
VALHRLAADPARADTVSLEEDAGLYVAEARVKEESKSIGQSVRDLYPVAVDKDVQILGLVRQGKRLPGFSQPRDAQGRFLVLEGDPKPSRRSWARPNWISPARKTMAACAAQVLSLVEAIVPEESRASSGGPCWYACSAARRDAARRFAPGQRFRDRVGTCRSRPATCCC